MNADETKSAVTRVAAPVLAWMAGRYHLDPSQVAAMMSDVGYVGTGLAVAVGFYQHWGMKKVPAASVAVEVKGIESETSPGSGVAVGAVVTGKVVGCLAAIGLVALALASSPAYAQTRPFKPTGDLIKDIQTTKQGAQATANEGIDDLVSKLDKLALPDFEFALAQAQASKNDVTLPCWQAWVDLIKARQAAALGADGQPLPLPDPHVITAIERISELLSILRPDSKISLACVQIAATAGKDVGTMITGILSGGALGLFKLPIPLP